MLFGHDKAFVPDPLLFNPFIGESGTGTSGYHAVSCQTVFITYDQTIKRIVGIFVW